MAKIEDEITHVLSEMKAMKVGSEEYDKAAKTLQILAEARSKRPALLVEPEVIVGAVVQIGLTILVLRYEEMHVIASKAFSWLGRRFW